MTCRLHPAVARAMRGGEVQLICPHCITHDPGPNGADPVAWQRAEGLDFTSDGPPLSICSSCDGRYRDWWTEEANWRLLPDELQRETLCEEDFLRLLQENGHDTSAIAITHEPWEFKVAHWTEHKDDRKSDTQIRFGLESLWCEVIEYKGDGTFAVRLRNNSVFDKCVRKGALFLARWNGSRRHGMTGRPLLLPICPLRLPRARRKQGRRVR